MGDINVLIVDDEAFFREALSTYLKNHEDITVIATADDGVKALEVLDKVSVDVVLCDVRMPHLDGLGFIHAVSEKGLSCRVVALTTFDDEQSMLGMLAAGAFGFVLKSARSEEIIDAVRTATRGGTTISPESATALRKYVTRFPPSTTQSLPARERQVLTLLQMGKSNATIADDLGIAETTVKKAVARLMQRYDAASRLELVVATRD